MAKKGWDRPLKVKIEPDIKAFQKLLIRHAPRGKKRDAGYTVGGKYYAYENPPPAPGRLKKSFKKPGAVKLSKSGKTIYVYSDLPYAKSVDKGHKSYYVGPSKKRYGDWLRAGGRKKGHRPMLMFKLGNRFFFKNVRIPKTSGSDYTGAAFREWAGRSKIKRNIKVKWSKTARE